MGARVSRWQLVGGQLRVFPSLAYLCNMGYCKACMDTETLRLAGDVGIQYFKQVAAIEGPGAAS